MNKKDDEKNLSFEEIFQQELKKQQGAKHEHTSNQRTPNQRDERANPNEQNPARGLSPSHFISPRFNYARITPMASSGLTQDLHKKETDSSKTQNRGGNGAQHRSDQKSQESAANEQTSRKVGAGCNKLHQFNETETSKRLDSDDKRLLKPIQNEEIALKGYLNQSIEQNSLKTKNKIDNKTFENLQEALKNYIDKKDNVTENKKIDLKIDILLAYKNDMNLNKDKQNLEALNPKEQEVLKDLNLNKESIIQAFTKRVKDKIKEVDNKITPNSQEIEKVIKMSIDLRKLNPSVEFSKSETKIINKFYKNIQEQAQKDKAIQNYNNSQ